MKIVRLSSSNVKRLSAVEVTPAPDGSLVTIGGKNGSGKSSVLDSIAYALGGNDLVPTQPIRTGQSEAKVTVDLGDYIVTRRFYREQVEDVPGAADSKMVWTSTQSVLVVTNREGAKYPSPQALLDKLYGKLTFDPLAFSREKPPAQNEILRRLVNLDFGLINDQRRLLFDTRAMEKKTVTLAESRLDNLPHHATPQGIYEITIMPIDEVSNEIRRAEELRQAAAEADRAASKMEQSIESLQKDRTLMAEKIKTLRAQLDQLDAEQAACDIEVDAKMAALADLKVVAVKTLAAVPDSVALASKFTDLDVQNTHARHNQAWLVQEQEVMNHQALVAELTKKLEQLDADKAAKLQGAKFPVAGLGLTDDGVTFEGLPLAEVSASVQLRVSIAIGLALNPTLKVLLIRNGNLLDDDSLKLVAEQAAEAGAQVWMEYVTSDAGDVSVMLEDGHVA